MASDRVVEPLHHSLMTTQLSASISGGRQIPPQFCLWKYWPRKLQRHIPFHAQAYPL